MWMAVAAVRLLALAGAAGSGGVAVAVVGYQLQRFN
jgi:hypothetical protein